MDDPSIVVRGRNMQKFPSNEIIIQQEKDVNGCPVERCERKECAKMPPLPDNCLAMKSLSLSVNKCGCVSWNPDFCLEVGKCMNGAILIKDKHGTVNIENVCYRVLCQTSFIPNRAVT